MTNDRKLQLMQEALDENLSPEEETELSLMLDRNPDDVVVFDRLQRLEDLLRTAPHERAPERLALTIMARIAEGMKKQKLLVEWAQEDLQITEAMINVAMSLVAVATMPLLVSAAWMMLNVRSNPRTLERVLQQIAALFMLVIDVMTVMMEKAEEVYDEDPEAAMALLTLMPSVLLQLVEQILDNDYDDNNE